MKRRGWWDMMLQAVLWGQVRATNAEWLHALRSDDNRPCEALASRDPGQVGT